MKKLIAVLMVTGLTVSMISGCGTSTDKGSSNDTGAETSAADGEATEDATKVEVDVEAELSSGTEAETAAAESTIDGEVYTIGICQLVQHESLDSATQGFQDALVEKLGEDKVQFDLQNASGDTANCATIVNQFVSSDVDLILANATASLQAAAAATNEIPVLGTSITDYATALEMDAWDGTSGRNISGTSDLAPLEGQAEIIQELFPDITNIGLLYCSAEANSVYQIDLIEGYLTEMGYACERFTFSDSNDLASVTTTAAEKSDIIYVPTDNTVASNAEIINNVCEPAETPVVTAEVDTCKGAGVATLSIDYYDIGYQTGLMAYEILVEGADITTMPVETVEDASKQYMAERCEKYGLTVPAEYKAIEVNE